MGHKCGTLSQKTRSRKTRISVHVQPEWVFTMSQNTQFAHWNGEVWDLYIHGVDLNAMRRKHPGLVLMTNEALEQVRYELNRKPVKEISEERFTVMLEVLPPIKWQNPGNNAGKSFQMEEYFLGGVVDIYVQWNGRFFEMRDDMDMPHEEIINLVKKIFSEK